MLYEGGVKMKEGMFRKGVAVAVIFLFIGIAIYPSVTAVDYDIDSSKLILTEVSKNEISGNDLVKVVVETCNVGGGQNYTVYLTKQQVQEVENLFDTINVDLNNAKTREEVVEIFNDAVISIGEYGLLPENTSVEEAQKLVTGGDQNPRVVKQLDRLYNKSKGKLDNNSNALCLIAGNTTKTCFCNPVTRVILVLLSLLFIFDITLYLSAFLIFGSIFWNMNPLSLGYTIGLGEYYLPGPTDPIITPADGWIYTYGLNRFKTWEGPLFGNLNLIETGYMFSSYYTGVLGFTGINIAVPDFIPSVHFYLGFALLAKIRHG